jgi:hypothetical protein
MGKCVPLKKSYRILISLCVLLCIFAIAGCSKPKATLPSDFIGVTKVEVIDYLQNKSHQFKFLVFTSTDNELIDGFKNKYIDKLVINRLPHIYLIDNNEQYLSSMYEVTVSVKPMVCQFQTIKLSFKNGVKEIPFGYYENIDLPHSENQIDVNLYYDLKSNNNIYDMQLIIHNYRMSDVYLNQINFVDKENSDRFVMAPLTDNIIISDNIKIISNIKLEVPNNTFYNKGLINLKFVTDHLEFEQPAVYLVDNLPDYYQLKESGIELNRLIIPR